MNIRILKIQKNLRRILMDYFLIKTTYPGVISIKEINLDRDLRRANVYISVMGSAGDVEKTKSRLEEDRLSIRSLINKRLRMKYCPYLNFFVNHISLPLSSVEKTLLNLKQKDLS